MSSHIGKSDPKLGHEVQKHLMVKGLQTPINSENFYQNTDENKILIISSAFEDILNTLGFDLSDDSLQDTPRRVAKMFVNEIFWGLDYAKFPKCTSVENKINYNNSFVLGKGITVNSTCEHHLVTIDGLATVAYIPNKTVLGLSKINRIVEYFSKRPQIQERLTEQIAETLCFITGSPDVAVYIDAKHYCTVSRGIQDPSSSTVTFAARGKFQEANSEVRREFLAIARNK